MQTIIAILDRIDSFMWGPVTITLLLGTGIYLTLLLLFPQFRLFFHAWKVALGKFGKTGAGRGDIKPLQALWMTLAGTVGIGNVAGVSTAVAGGGPGALLWMWITAIVGMATKATEVTLALNFRETLPDGTMLGGPFLTMEKGIPWKAFGKVLAVIFAIAVAISAFGIGNGTQANSLALAFAWLFPKQYEFTVRLIVGIAIAILTWLVIVGGVKRIAEVTDFLVPFMVVVYLVFGVIFLIVKIDAVAAALSYIFSHALTGEAAVGGFAGASVMQTIRYGVARGQFSNEAGLGSSPIGHSAATVIHPWQQGMIAMLDPFIDTILVCSITGLIDTATGAWITGLSSSLLAQEAFRRVFGPIGPVMVAFILIFFSYSTVLAWSYYGRQSLVYLARVIQPDPDKFARLYPKIHYVYSWIFSLILIPAAVTSLGIVWLLSDIFNGFESWPNLISLIILGPLAARLLKEYQAKAKELYGA